MARPTTKKDLLNLASSEFNKMQNLIDSLSDDDQNKTFNYNEEIGKEEHWKRDKNIRDVLVHLHEWHHLLINWIKNNEEGKESPFLPEPYSWKTYGKMNIEFWNKHQNTSYEKAKKLLNESYDEVIKLVEKFSDDELFTKKHFSWTGTTNLGSYAISATSSHYNWAIKKIKLHIKTLNK